MLRVGHVARGRGHQLGHVARGRGHVLGHVLGHVEHWRIHLHGGMLHLRGHVRRYLAWLMRRGSHLMRRRICFQLFRLGLKGRMCKARVLRRVAWNGNLAWWSTGGYWVKLGHLMRSLSRGHAVLEDGCRSWEKKQVRFLVLLDS